MNDASEMCHIELHQKSTFWKLYKGKEYQEESIWQFDAFSQAMYIWKKIRNKRKIRLDHNHKIGHKWHIHERSIIGIPPYRRQLTPRQAMNVCLYVSTTPRNIYAHTHDVAARDFWAACRAISCTGGRERERERALLLTCSPHQSSRASLRGGCWSFLFWCGCVRGVGLRGFLSAGVLTFVDGCSLWAMMLKLPCRGHVNATNTFIDFIIECAPGELMMDQNFRWDRTLHIMKINKISERFTPPWYVNVYASIGEKNSVFVWIASLMKDS